MACHNTIKTLPIKCYLLSLRKKAGLAQYEKIWNKVESQLFEKLATETVKGEGKQKAWKICIKKNCHSKDVPYDTYCNATAVLKIDSVFKQGKNYHSQAYVKSREYVQKTKDVTC